MAQISYPMVPFPVREDLVAAHRSAWKHLARPGTWWSGTERVAIAVELRQARSCVLCMKRKSALSPHATSGSHDRASSLPNSAVDVIHRVATDPGRLTKTWFEEIMASRALTDGHYVEIVGVVAGTVSIDRFCWALGVPLHPLPQPEPGEPSRYRPAAARQEQAWVPLIPSLEAKDAEADLWPPGRVGNVIRALSLVPDAVRQLRNIAEAHYVSIQNFMDLTWRRSLSRSQMELIAGRVSALHECFY